MHVSWFDLWNLLNLYISTPVSLSFFSIALITILDASTWFTYPDLLQLEQHQNLWQQLTPSQFQQKVIDF